jgi:protoheme IX farnesyltransferase
MGYDSDIDALMRRTRGRPVPAGRVQRADAMGLGVVLSLFSVGIMALAANFLAAGLLAFTIFFYAVVYTRWLKRRTPQNIVIGGLAGALPPVVGWAAASGSAPLQAWLLVAIIFIWTPPHFWALSLYTSEDYAKAGVPMMPLTAGPASTRRQILIYSLILAPLAITPAFAGLGGSAYLAVSGLGGVLFVVLAFRLAASHAGESLRPVRRSVGRASAGRGPVREPDAMSNPFGEDPQAARARRMRSIAIALSLAAFVVIVFVITLVKKGGG